MYYITSTLTLSKGLVNWVSPLTQKGSIELCSTQVTLSHMGNESAPEIKAFYCRNSTYKVVICLIHVVICSHL